MGKLENLMPIEEVNARKTPEQRRESARKAGIASGEAQRKKKEMKKVLEAMLSETGKNGMTYREMATLGLIKGAVKGDARNYKVILETLGETNDDAEQDRRDGIITDLLEALSNAKSNR